jgi:hypothetical protein
MYLFKHIHEIGIVVIPCLQSNRVGGDFLSAVLQKLPDQLFHRHPPNLFRSHIGKPLFQIPIVITAGIIYNEKESEENSFKTREERKIYE